MDFHYSYLESEQEDFRWQLENVHEVIMRKLNDFNDNCWVHYQLPVNRGRKFTKTIPLIVKFNFITDDEMKRCIQECIDACDVEGEIRFRYLHVANVIIFTYQPIDDDFLNVKIPSLESMSNMIGYDRSGQPKFRKEITKKSKVDTVYTAHPKFQGDLNKKSKVEQSPVTVAQLRPVNVLEPCELEQLMQLPKEFLPVHCDSTGNAASFSTFLSDGTNICDDDKLNELKSSIELELFH